MVYLIISLIIIIIYFFFQPQYISIEPFESDDFQLVISRYNENLEWLKNKPFSDCKNIIIYNKGNNENYYKPENSKTIKLNNVGKCDHTYIYHIVENYNNLPSIGCVFLPGSANMDVKYPKALQTYKSFVKYKKSTMVCLKFNNIKEQLYNFEMKNYETAYPSNKTGTETKTTLAHIRPFGKWFENKFGNLQIKHVTFGGMFAVSRNHILNRPKDFYQKLLSELNYTNPEVGHFIERSWEAIFYPMKGARFLKSKYKLDEVGAFT